MQLILINETLIVQFHFWLAGHLQSGMSCLEEFYYYLNHFDRHQYQQAYEFATFLADQQIKVVMSASETGYGVWVQLQADAIQATHYRLTPMYSTLERGIAANMAGR